MIISKSIICIFMSLSRERTISLLVEKFGLSKLSPLRIISVISQWIHIRFHWFLGYEVSRSILYKNWIFHFCGITDQIVYLQNIYFSITSRCFDEIKGTQKESYRSKFYQEKFVGLESSIKGRFLVGYTSLVFHFLGRNIFTIFHSFYSQKHSKIVLKHEFYFGRDSPVTETSLVYYYNHFP